MTAPATGSRAPSTTNAPAGSPGAAGEFVVGVMRMEVEGRDSDRFLGHVEAAVAGLDRAVTDALGVRARSCLRLVTARFQK